MPPPPPPPCQSLPAICLNISRAFSCTRYDNDPLKTYLTVDQSISCTSDEYLALFWYACVMVVIFPVGLPVICLFQLHGLRHLLGESGIKTAMDKR
mmetsp:Transcript_87403/g.248086  ORF Transcript_87403/g.248086 Transcript_87403/m.248086 type:complete len:96 (-) Transcript_87403:2051-2338(-)